MSDAIAESKPQPTLCEVKKKEAEKVQDPGQESDNIGKVKTEKDPELAGQSTITATQDHGKDDVQKSQDHGNGDGQKSPDKGSRGPSDAVDQGTASATSDDADITQQKERDPSEVDNADPGKPAEDESKFPEKGDDDASRIPGKADKDESRLPGKAGEDESKFPTVLQVKLEPQSPVQTFESISGDGVEKTGSVAKAEENSVSQKDNNAVESSSHVDDVVKQKISSPKDSVTVKEEVVSGSDENTLKSKVDEERTDATNVPEVDENVVSKETVNKENVSEEHIPVKTDDPLVAQRKEEKPQGGSELAETKEDNASNMGMRLKAVKIEENEPSVELTVKANESEENEFVLSEEASALANDASRSSETERMQVDDVNSAPDTTPDAAFQKKEAVAPEAVVTESKAVHEIIAEQSVRTERESTAVPPVPLERTDSTVAPETSVPNVPESTSVPNVPEATSVPNVPEATSLPNVPEAISVPNIPEAKVEIKEVVDDDWDIPASDEEGEGNSIPEGESGEKKRRVVVKRGYWEPPAEVIVELYRRLDQEGILELSWKCPGRRPPSEEGDKEEEKEQLEEELNEEEMEISPEEDPTEFDFDIDTDSSVQKMTPRRGIGSGQAQGSGKKRVARMDKVLSDIFRHRKIDSALTDERKEDRVAVETSEAMDTTPASDVTPSRPPDKFHIRSDLT